MPNVQNYIFENTNLLDLTLYQYGIEDCNPLQLYGPVKRNHFLIHFILKGKGFYQIEDQLHSLKQGQAFLITPNIPTTYYADEKEPWSYAWIEFDGLKAAEYLKRAGLTLKNPIYTPRYKEIKGTPSAPDYLLHMLEHHTETSLYLISHLYLLLDSLIKYSKKEAERRPGTLKDFYMKEAVHYIENHYAEDITVEEMAGWCNLNRSYFSKLFKESLEITPQQFLIRYRMTKACELLSHTNIPIKEIAPAVGYPSVLHFSRAFKNIYDVSPRYWRTNNRS